MKRLDSLKTEQSRLRMEVDREEEFLTNTLQRRLTSVLREKAATDGALERAAMERAHAEERLASTLAEREALQQRLDTEEAHLADVVARKVAAVVRRR